MQKGFTLIELLVTIALAGAMAAIGFTSLSSVQTKARDAQRKSDIQQIRVALEVYRSDTSTYPVTTAFSCGGTLASGTNVYMQKIPCDPKTGAIYKYERPTSQTYIIVACLENGGDKDVTTDIKCDTSVAPGSAPEKAYVVTSP